MHAYLPLPTRHRDVDEAPRICDSLLRSALGGLLLLLRFNLYSRRQNAQSVKRFLVLFPPPAKWDGMGWFGVLLAFSEPCMFGGVGFRVDDADGIIGEE